MPASASLSRPASTGAGSSGSASPAAMWTPRSPSRSWRSLPSPGSAVGGNDLDPDDAELAGPGQQPAHGRAADAEVPGDLRLGPVRLVVHDRRRDHRLDLVGIVVADRSAHGVPLTNARLRQLHHSAVPADAQVL